MSKYTISMSDLARLLFDAFDIKCRCAPISDSRQILPASEDCFHSNQFLNQRQLESSIDRSVAGEITFVTDRLFISWILARTESDVLLAGPVLLFPGNLSEVINALKKLGLSERSLSDYRQYQQNLPSPPEDFLTRFLKVISGAISDNVTPKMHWVDLFNRSSHSTDADNNTGLFAYDTYKVESEYMEAVFAGNTQAATDAFIKMQNRSEKQSGANSPRNETDLYRHIVYCTLARVAAYQAGAAPFILDEIFQENMYFAEQERSSETIFKRTLRITALACRQVQIVKAGKYSNAIRPIVCYILEHYLQPITLSSVAEAFGMQKTYLSAIFRKETGVTFTDYVNNTRLELAAEKLRLNMQPIYEIAESVGITDYNYFSRIFKKKYAMTPSEYRLLPKHLRRQS